MINIMWFRNRNEEWDFMMADFFTIPNLKKGARFPGIANLFLRWHFNRAFIYILLNLKVLSSSSSIGIDYAPNVIF